MSFGPRRQLAHPDSTNDSAVSERPSRCRPGHYFAGRGILSAMDLHRLERLALLALVEVALIELGVFRLALVAHRETLFLSRLSRSKWRARRRSHRPEPGNG
jgi:hypothetical protein